MAKIVCTKTTTAISNAGDCVEIQEDDVELTGPGYEGYQVIFVKGKKRDEIREIVNAKIPEQSMVDDKEMWKDSEGKWRELAKRPKYSITFKDLTETDIKNLADEKFSISSKDTILGKASDTISLDSANNVLASDSK